MMLQKTPVGWVLCHLPSVPGVLLTHQQKYLVIPTSTLQSFREFLLQGWPYIYRFSFEDITHILKGKVH